MRIKTGYTVYELVKSVDVDNNPVPGPTFNSVFYIDGIISTGVTLSITTSNVTGATYNASFSASTFGMHQYELKNSLTNVIYISDIYDVRPDNEVDTSPTIYVGL